MKTKYLEVNQFSVRLSDQERDFINENYNELVKDGNLELSYSKFFMMCVSNAISTVRPKVAELSKPEDLQKIETMQKRIDEIMIENNNLDVANVGLMAGHKELLAERFSLEKKLEVMKELSPDEIIFKLEPKEKFLLEQLAKLMNRTPKELLINDFLMVYEYRGAGDYKIPQLSRQKLNEIDNYFKAKS